jgi:hypothetical protein
MRVRKPGQSVANGETPVFEYWARLGVSATRFEKAEMRHGRTPDFLVMYGDSLALFSEVKTVQEDDWLDRRIGEAPPGTSAGASRPDPAYNRIGNRIHSAAGQFDAVNPNLRVPNVLAFVNHDFDAGVQDPAAVPTGNAYTDCGSILPCATK